VVFMWAVTDFTKENGATHVIPGSHLWPAGRQPTPDDPIECLEMPRGSFAAWLGATFHGAGTNHTDIARVGTQIGFNCGWLRPHEANLLLVPPLVARDLPLNVQEVLGYRAHRGMLGCIEQQSPLEKLGLLTSAASNSKAVALGPDPFTVEELTQKYFARRHEEMPADIASELRQLAGTNAARAAASRDDDREVLEVVARAQSRHVLNHLLAGNYDDLLDELGLGEAPQA
jgi:Phytanoyl-CoA dioxygenase (PhyH)